MIRSLCAEHRALEAQAARLLGIVAADVPDAAAVAAMRWQMAQEFRDHCAREDQLIHDRLLPSGDAAAAEAARAYRQEHGLLASDFANYMAAWPVGRITREWERFRAETRILLADLRERFVRAEGVLYAHLERVIACQQAAA